MGTPPELESLNSMLRWAKIVALIFMILFLLSALGTLALAAIFIGFALFGIVPLIFFLIDLLIWMQVGQIQNLVQQGQYGRAKEKTFLWMILGLILGGLIIGILLILAYTKFDPVINWQRQSGGQGQPGWGQPQPAAWGQPQPQQPGWGQPQPAAQPGAWNPPPAQGAQPAQGAGWSQPPAQSAPPMAAPAPVAAPAAPAAPSAVMCPRCGKPATWIPQYSRWYCYSDAQYV